MKKVNVHLIRKFNNEECEKLRGKPKIFLIQACRGEQQDLGVVQSTSGMRSLNPPGASPNFRRVCIFMLLNRVFLASV